MERINMVAVVALANSDSLDDELRTFGSSQTTSLLFGSPVKSSTPKVLRPHILKNNYAYPHNQSPLTESIQKQKNRLLWESKCHKVFNGFDQLDVRFWALLITLGIFVIAYKMVLIALPYANAESAIEMWSYTQMKFHELERQIEWRHIWPLLCGLVFTIFSVAMVYWDSNVPGVIPPSPFSSPTKPLYGQKKKSSMDFNYICAFATGLIVTVLLYVQSLSTSP